MSLNKALEDLKFDKRLVELHIKQGRLTKEELEKQKNSLPDLAAECETLDLDGEDKKVN